MRAPLTIIAAIAAVTATAGAASAQWATEQFIPIGESPGASGVTAFTGTIESINHDTGEMTVLSSGESRAVRCEEGTEVYVDRSDLGESNTRGGIASLTEGAFVEVNLGRQDAQRPATQAVRTYSAAEGVATWVKVAASDGE